MVVEVVEVQEYLLVGEEVEEQEEVVEVEEDLLAVEEEEEERGGEGARQGSPRASECHRTPVSGAGVSRPASPASRARRCRH